MEPTEPNEGSAKSRKKKQSLTCKDAKQKCYASTRSGLLPFTRFIEGLSEEKRNHVKDLGLGGLLGLQIKQNRNMEVVELLKRLNWQTRILNVHGKALPITEEVVGRIMGLPCGGRDISKLKINLGKLRHRYNVRRESRKELIEQLISMEPGEEWQANFILLANHCVMRPSSSLSCSPNSLEFMDDVRNLREMNWCKYILDGLCAGAKDLQLQLLEIDNGSRSSLNLKGCTVLLEIFYVEHVQSAVVLAPWNHRPLPRLSDWTDDSMRKVYASVGKKFDDSSVILVSSNEEQYQRGFAEIRTKGGSYPLQQIDSNLTLSMVMEKIRIHEMRLDGIEKQLKVITDLVRQIVPAGCGQQRDKMEGLVQRMGGWEHGEPSTCNGKMVEPIVDNIGEDIATPCAPKNDVVRVSPEIEILGADKVEDCYVPSPPPKIEVHPVKKNLQSDAIEAVKTENPVAPLEKTMDEVHDEMGVEMDVEEKNIGAEDKLNVHRSKRRRKPQGGREIIVTRSMKAKELDDLISIESNNSVFRISPTKPTRKRKDLGLRSTSELKKGKMQQAPYITEADMKAKKKKGTKPGALFLV